MDLELVREDDLSWRIEGISDGLEIVERIGWDDEIEAEDEEEKKELMGRRWRRKRERERGEKWWRRDERRDSKIQS